MMMKADGGELEEEGGGSSQTPILYTDLVCLLFNICTITTIAQFRFNVRRVVTSGIW